MRKITLSFLLFLSFISSYSQVSIGGSEIVVEGTLLQLEENHKNGDNSEKGLLLPRVSLTDINNLYPMFGTSSDTEKSTYTANKLTINENHTGLLVYNVEEDECIGIFKGVYYWDGNKWNSLFIKENYDEDTGLLTDRQGNTYHTADFGDAGIWMTENLRTTLAQKCVPDLYVYDGHNSLTEAQYHWPSAQGSAQMAPDTWESKMGILYNWAVATGLENSSNVDQNQEIGTTPGSNEVESLYPAYIQGICPFGWHIPSDREWNKLEKQLADNYATYSDAAGIQSWNSTWETTLGSRGNHSSVLKSKRGFLGYDPEGKSFASDGDPFGFDAYLLGDVNDGSASNYGKYTYFWSSSNYSYKGSDEALIRQIELPRSGYDDGVGRYTLPKGYLVCVRCKKDGT